MKIPVFLLGMLFLAVNSMALEKVADANLREEITKNIRMNNYACDICTNAYVIGEDDRGFVYRIICNNNLVAFTVIVTPSGKYIVKPW